MTWLETQDANVEDQLGSRNQGAGRSFTESRESVDIVNGTYPSAPEELDMANISWPFCVLEPSHNWLEVTF